MKRTGIEVILGLAVIILCGVLMDSRNDLIKERDFAVEKLERFEARYEMGDLEHTIQFQHSCGHKELFSMNRDQIHYLMELQAHACYECRKKPIEPKEPL